MYTRSIQRGISKSTKVNQLQKGVKRENPKPQHTHTTIEKRTILTPRYFFHNPQSVMHFSHTKDTMRQWVLNPQPHPSTNYCGRRKCQLGYSSLVFLFFFHDEEPHQGKTLQAHPWLVNPGYTSPPTRIQKMLLVRIEPIGGCYCCYFIINLK
jgi:hypothetical protein